MKTMWKECEKNVKKAGMEEIGGHGLRYVSPDFRDWTADIIDMILH